MSRPTCPAASCGAGARNPGRRRSSCTVGRIVGLHGPIGRRARRRVHGVPVPAAWPGALHHRRAVHRRHPRRRRRGLLGRHGRGTVLPHRSFLGRPPRHAHRRRACRPPPRPGRRRPVGDRRRRRGVRHGTDHDRAHGHPRPPPRLRSTSGRCEAREGPGTPWKRWARVVCTSPCRRRHPPCPRCRCLLSVMPGRGTRSTTSWPARRWHPCSVG